MTDKPKSVFHKHYISERLFLKKDDVSYFSAIKMSREDVAYIHEEVIAKGFLDLNTATGDRQHMTFEEFEGDVRSDSVVKFWAEYNGRIIAILTLHIGLDRVSWVDVEAIKKVQNIMSPKVEPLYIGTVVIDPTFNGVDRVGKELMKQSFRDYLDQMELMHKDILIYFDCVWKNVPFIPATVQAALHEAQGNEIVFDVLVYDSNENKPQFSLFDVSEMPEMTEGHAHFVVGPSRLAIKR